VKWPGIDWWKRNLSIDGRMAEVVNKTSVSISEGFDRFVVINYDTVHWYF